MTSAATSIVHCSDSTKIRVGWGYLGAEEREWAWNQSHWPRPEPRSSTLTPSCVAHAAQHLDLCLLPKQMVTEFRAT